MSPYERIVRDDPTLREHVQSLVHQLRRLAVRMPGTMPERVTAAFERLGCRT